MFKSLKLLLFFLLIANLIPSLSEAKLFQNAYVSFELPENWKCKLEGTEWVCVNRYSKKAKEAIIILTAKEVGPVDTMSAFNAHLKTPKPIHTKSGQPTKSKVIHVRERKIANHPWIDGMHLGSEVVSYYTRYLVTIKNSLVVIVTFSAHKQYYTKYSKDFLRAINSLKSIASKNILARNNPSIRPATPSGPLGAPIGSAIPDDMYNAEEFPGEDSSGGPNTATILGIIFLLGGIGIYFLIKKL